jgi:hypothetical protein
MANVAALIKTTIMIGLKELLGPKGMGKPSPS